MKVWQAVLVGIAALSATRSVVGQAPVLGNIDAPYPALQSQIRIAGGTYGPGAVAYGPAGTPLVVSGQNFGNSGTVLFPGPTKGTTIAASVSIWTGTTLFLTVPSGATSGLVSVNAAGGSSNSLPFVVTPGNYSGSCPAHPSTKQVEITTSSLPSGIVGEAYDTTLTATGGIPPYTWSLLGNSLPAGLTLSASTGAITGTPTSAAGPLNIVLTAADSSAQAAEATLSITIGSQNVTSAATIYSYTAGYDLGGNLQTLSDSVDGNSTFGYDQLNRLISVSQSSSQLGAIATHTCWSYDPFGNRTAETYNGASGCPSLPSAPAATASYNGLNQMTWTTVNSASGGLQYDSAGNVTGDNVNSYLYDAEGRICAVKQQPVSGTYTMTGYIYDSSGMRVAKGSITSWSCDPTANGFNTSSETDFVLGLDGEQVTETAADADGTMAWQHTNVWAGDMLLATYDDDGLHFHLSDLQGSRRVQANYAGAVEQDCTNAPFGQLSCTNSLQYPTEHHFTGKEYDAESGNDYFPARYYSASTGRWLSPDPYEGSYDWANPQSFNRYAYVNGRPTSATDPSGEEACATTIALAELGPVDAIPGVFCAAELYGTFKAMAKFNPIGFVGDIAVSILNRSDFHGSLGGRPSVGAWNDKFGVPYGGLTNGIQQALGLPTMADVGGIGIDNYGPGPASYADCVKDSGNYFSLQHIAQTASGGRLGNGSIASAVLGNPFSDLIDFGQKASWKGVWTNVKNGISWKGSDLLAVVPKVGGSIAKAGSLINLWNYGTTGNSIWMCGIGR